jgi:hypothetical protein
VIRGSLLAIPIEKSILYVESLYLAAANGQLPELKRVIVAYGNNIAMEETLDLALRKIFGGVAMTDREPQAGVKPPATGAEQSDRETALEALGHFRRAQDFLRQGNWGAFGEELKKTGEILLTLEKKAGKAK